MFERYTEKARRIIFFARYEASQFGSPYIEPEHLLLGLLREDKALANRLFPSHEVRNSIREKVEAHTTFREKVSTSVDLPLSHQSRGVLVYGAEEAERMNHEHIGSVHLLLGLLREERCFAAELLRAEGLALDLLRQQAQQSDIPPIQAGSTSFPLFDKWLSECEARGNWTIRQRRAGDKYTHFAIYAADQLNESEAGPPPAERLSQIQKQIGFIAEEIEHALANHELGKVRDSLRLLREQFNPKEPTPQVPLLCIEIVRNERFSEVLKRCDHHIAEGVGQVWLLEPVLKRAYTITRPNGLGEFRGEILQIESPPLEMDLRRIFD